MGKSWAYCYDPESKEQLREWLRPQENHLQKPQRTLVSFFDSQGLIYSEFIRHLNIGLYCLCAVQPGICVKDPASTPGQLSAERKVPSYMYMSWAYRYIRSNLLCVWCSKVRFRSCVFETREKLARGSRLCHLNTAVGCVLRVRN